MDLDDAHQGLGTFFRDLLVSKDNKSIGLFNSDKETKQKFKEVSSNHSIEYFIECINITNTCDINFSKSINQNLLIELTFMKLASLNYNDEKKKFNYKIIPASYFNANLITNKNVIKEEILDVKPKLDIEIDKLTTSRLSLKSVGKKEFINSSENNIQESSHENNPYNETDIIALWEKYSEIMEEKGRYNIASILRIDNPTLDQNTIKIVLPNSTNKVELENEKKQLLIYLRENLKNNEVYMEINVDESVQEKLVYTDKDKYELMKKKNPDIEILKDSFNLSI